MTENKKNNRKEKKGFKEFSDALKLRRNMALIVAMIGFILYANTISLDYVLDDFSVIKENNVTTLGMKAIPTIFKHSYRYGYFNLDDGLYRPLTLAMFAIEWEISPDNPHLSHFINVLLYALTGWVLFMTLSRLLKNYTILLPFIISLLFICHPVHTEVVANIKSRDELLCFLLVFCSIYFLLDYIEKQSTTKLVLAAVCFFVAFLSKETVITMIAVIPLALYYFTNADKSKIIKSTLWLSITAGVYLLIRMSILGDLKDNSISAVDNLLLTAPDAGQKIATAIKILGLYLKVLLLPHPLVYDYSFNQIPIVSLGDPGTLIALVLYAGMAVYGITRLVKKDLFAFGIWFYLITISLFANIIFMIGAAMAERFIYFASFGFCFVLGTGILKITKTNLSPVFYNSLAGLLKKHTFVAAITILICVLYGGKTVSRNSNWKDNYTLYAHDVSLAPNSTRSHYYLGNEIIKVIAPKEADPAKRVALIREGIKELQKSLAIYPKYPDAMSQIGVGYYRIDSLDKAASFFIEALKYNPNDVITLNNLAALYFTKGNYQQAIEMYKKVITINPRYTDAIVNLGNCYGMIKEFDQAIVYFNQAINIQPNYAKAYYFLSITYKFKGDMANYERYFAEANRLDPSLKKP